MHILINMYLKDSEERGRAVNLRKRWDKNADQNVENPGISGGGRGS